MSEENNDVTTKDLSFKKTTFLYFNTNDTYKIRQISGDFCETEITGWQNKDAVRNSVAYPLVSKSFSRLQQKREKVRRYVDLWPHTPCGQAAFPNANGRAVSDPSSQCKEMLSSALLPISPELDREMVNALTWWLFGRIEVKVYFMLCQLKIQHCARSSDTNRGKSLQIKSFEDALSRRRKPAVTLQGIFTTGQPHCDVEGASRPFQRLLLFIGMDSNHDCGRQTVARCLWGIEASASIHFQISLQPQRSRFFRKMWIHTQRKWKPFIPVY